MLESLTLSQNLLASWKQYLDSQHKTCRFMCAGSTSSCTAAAPHIALFLPGWLEPLGSIHQWSNFSPLSTGGCALLESHLAIKTVHAGWWVGFFFWAPPTTSTTTSLICPYAHVVLQDMSFHVCWFYKQLHRSSSTHCTLFAWVVGAMGVYPPVVKLFTALTT